MNIPTAAASKSPLMKILSAAAFSLFFSLAVLHADEALQQVQRELKDAGYFFGEVNGQPGDETTQAIKRFQIRNGLDVTGELNDETRAALKNNPDSSSSTNDSSASDQPLVVTPASPAPEQNDKPDLRAPDSISTAQSDSEFLKRKAPPAASAGIPLVAYADIFRRTPYASAPPVVQRDTVKRAEARLGQIGLYDGELDGVPGPQLQRAISQYQERTELEVTGRLDMATLDQLHLLPRMERSEPRVRVIVRPHVFRGVWIP